MPVPLGLLVFSTRLPAVTDQNVDRTACNQGLIVTLMIVMVHRNGDMI